MDVQNDARRHDEPSGVSAATPTTEARPTAQPIENEPEMSQEEYERLLDQYDKLKSLAEGEVVRGRLGTLAIGFVLLMAALHVAAFLRRNGAVVTPPR